LLKNAGTVSAWTLLSRILGLFRDRLWAGALGGVHQELLDAFLVSFAVPNLLRNLFGEGALSAAFIPRYVQARERDPAAAEAFAGAVLSRLALGLSLLAALGMAVAAGLMLLGEGKTALVATMLFPQVPYLVFICVVAIMGGMLNGRRRFAVPAASPVVLNAVMIATVWMNTDEESRVMPYAVLAAGILTAALNVVALKSSGGMPPFTLKNSPELGELRRATLPVLLATSVYQVNALLDSIIAMWLVPGDGAVSFLYFGNRLLQFPMALIGHGVTTAAYPELARRANEGWAATGEGVCAAARLQAFWLMPAAVGLVATAEPLVRAIYQTGHFGDDAVARTVLVVRMLGLALLPISLAKLLVRAFHARRDQATPVRVSLWMVGLNLALNLVLARTPLKEAGLALATAISSFVGCVIYLAIMKRRGAGMVVAPLTLLRPALAAGAMAAAVLALLAWWPQPTGRGSGMGALRLGAAVALGGAVYLALAGTGWLRGRRPAGAEPAPAAAESLE
jgi:putative peptidoglycan lipid II flippase